MEVENMIEVAEVEDPRLEAYRMVRDRDMAGRKGIFMAEGRVVIQALLDHGRYGLDSVLVSRKKLPGLMDIMERVPAEVPIYVVDHETMEKVVGFSIHRGLLAAGRRKPLMRTEDVLAELPQEGPRTVLVLEGLTNHDNTGACFRNAAAFGVDAVLLDRTCCDPLYRKSIRVSVGHALALPYGHGEPIEGVLRGLKAAGYKIAALALSDRSEPLDSCQRPAEKLAVLLGTEGTGLSKAALALADYHFEIPMAGCVDSLNVAAAGAVSLFALRAR